MKTGKNDLFISYRREDNNGVAREIAKGLERQGYSVFLDTSEIVPGEAFPEVIEDAIENAHDVILIVSKSYFGYSNGQLRIADKQDWCRRELANALRGGKHIVPVVLDRAFFQIPGYTGTERPDEQFDDISEVFSFNYIEYSRTEDTDEFIARLQDALSEISRANSKRNYYKEELIEIESRHDPTSVNVDLKKLVLSMREEDIVKYIYPILNDDEPLTLQFLAYYSIFSFYRRMGYETKIVDLVEKYGERFADLDLPFDHIVRSQYYLHLYNNAPSDLESLDSAIFHAERANELLTTNAGVLVTYSELIAIACNVDREKYAGCVPKAMRFIKTAMELSKQYPKHFYILGLLESAIGNYGEGIQHIRTAIDLENSEGKDAFLRIAKYYDTIHDIKLRQLKEELIMMIERKQ